MILLSELRRQLRAAMGRRAFGLVLAAPNAKGLRMSRGFSCSDINEDRRVPRRLQVCSLLCIAPLLNRDLQQGGPVDQPLDELKEQFDPSCCG